MFGRAKEIYQGTLDEIRSAGLFKDERIIVTPQSAKIGVVEPVREADGRKREVEENGKTTREVINFCANNYLGLSSHPRVVEAAQEAIKSHGFGMSSVRFICGTQDLHKTLEA